MTIKNFWLKQSNLIDWHFQPTIIYKKKSNNHIDWYPNGKLNIFHNCITKNINKGLGKKIAIYSGVDDATVIDNTTGIIRSPNNAYIQSYLNTILTFLI